MVLNGVQIERTRVQFGCTRLSRSQTRGAEMGFREHFTNEVRRLRDKHDMTTREVADKVGYSYDALKSFLIGYRTPTAKLAVKLDELFDTDGMFAALQAEARQDASSFGELRESEQRATAIRIWDMRIPGLLQTPAHASALLRKPELVEERIERQGIFAREESPSVHVVISEGALYQEFGGPAVLREQLLHLIREDAPWTLQVMPDQWASPTGVDGPLTLLEFEGDEPSIAFVDARNGGTVVDESKQVAEYWRQWDRLTSESASPSGACR